MKLYIIVFFVFAEFYLMRKKSKKVFYFVNTLIKLTPRFEDLHI